MIRQCVEDIEICRTRQCTMQQSRTTAQCKPGSLIAVLSHVRAMQCYTSFEYVKFGHVEQCSATKYKPIGHYFISGMYFPNEWKKGGG